MESRNRRNSGRDVGATDRQARIPAIEFERMGAAMDARQHLNHVRARGTTGRIPGLFE
jgi:hypothetical protein